MSHPKRCIISVGSLVIFVGVIAFFVVRFVSVIPPEEVSMIDPESELLIKEELSSADPGEEVPAQEPITILFTGDVMMGRYVETLMNRYGPEYPFVNWQKFDRGQKYTVLNLEGPIVTNHRQTPDFTTQFSFAPRVADILASQDVTHISLANNHTLDQGTLGFQQTQSYLEQAGIRYFGHQGRSVAQDVLVEELSHGGEVIWIGLNEAVSPQFTLSESVDLVESMVQQYPEAMPIITIHWGDEYQLSSNARQQEIAHALVEAGGQIIIGHHPHVVQEVELYQGVPIFYSLGNTIFDQYFSQDTQEGLLVYLTLSDSWSMEIAPIESDMSRPQPMSQPRQESFLQELIERSPTINSECLKRLRLDVSC